jgi:hypothetical protein
MTSVDGSIDILLKEYVYAGPPRNIEDLVARIKAAMTAVDASILRPI